MEVIAVGTGAIDVVHEVATYPKEDAKARSLASWKCRGGNAASALVVCSQLGGRCWWLSTSTDPAKDNDAAFIHADMTDFGVDCSLAVIETEGSMPVSYILSSRITGSRTIVHSRTIAELSCEAFAKQLERYLKEVRQNMNAPVWLHFEGRNMETVRQMMLHVRARAPQAKISVEIEFPRYPWSLAKTLASLADYVFISKDYIRDNVNLSSAQEFFEGILAQQWGEEWDQWVKAFICPWGPEGVYYLEMAGSMARHIPATRLDNVVESNGAGDSFIGAALAGLSRINVPLHLVMKTACDIATTKCSQHGFKFPEDKISMWQQDLDHPEVMDDVDAEMMSNFMDQDRCAQLDSLDLSSEVLPTTHSVTSEVELELDRVQHTIIKQSDPEHLFIVALLPTFVEDADGDIVVPRRQAKKRRKSSGQEVSLPASNVTRGTQLWRAAFLLAEYIYSAPDIFKRQVVLELGCGIGFTSIVASRMSRCVYATDSDENALLLAKRNTKSNHHGDLRFRLLDWDDCSLIPTPGGTLPTAFGWTHSDQTDLDDLTIIIASDVFYDDVTTTLFLRAVHRLMLQHSSAKTYVSLERRSVFSAAAMRVISLGYDTFHEHICFHDPSTCHTHIRDNLVRCQICSAERSTSTGRDEEEDFLRFITHEIDIGDFPQRFRYDRLSTLMFWVIDAVVVC
ncbi:hypothetical protein PRNP1_007168 [Phytophthora ramorum]